MAFALITMSALQKACCGWTGEQLQASVNRSEGHRRSRRATGARRPETGAVHILKAACRTRLEESRLLDVPGCGFCLRLDCRERGFGAQTPPPPGQSARIQRGEGVRRGGVTRDASLRSPQNFCLKPWVGDDASLVLMQSFYREVTLLTLSYLRKLCSGGHKNVSIEMLRYIRKLHSEGCKNEEVPKNLPNLLRGAHLLIHLAHLGLSCKQKMISKSAMN